MKAIAESSRADVILPLHFFFPFASAQQQTSPPLCQGSFFFFPFLHLCCLFMTQSSALRFFGLNKDRKSASSAASQKLAVPTPADTAVPSPPSPHSQANVHGWLMTVPGYRDEQSLASEPSNFRDDNTATQQAASNYEQNGYVREDEQESATTTSGSRPCAKGLLQKDTFSNKILDKLKLRSL